MQSTLNLAGISGLLRQLVIDHAVPETMARDIAQKADKKRQSIARYCWEQQLVPSAKIAEAASRHFGLPLFDLQAFDFNQAPLHILNEKILRQYQILPLFQSGKTLSIALADPAKIHDIEGLKFQIGLNIEPILVDFELLKNYLEKALGQLENQLLNIQENEFDQLDHLDIINGEEINDETYLNSVNNKDSMDEAPVVRFVNKVLLEAIKRSASDIHFEPYEKNYRIRFRLDGVLSEMVRPPSSMNNRIAARLKVMAKLDLAERRMPQDGRIKLNLSRSKSIDFRVSTCPTLHGEKIVLRILDGTVAQLGIDSLGYEANQKSLLLNALKKPHGMILVTGPTGSGKTVSLYTCLELLNQSERNICTAEDPIEINLTGINQLQIHPKIGLTFAHAMRGFLRQDPDVIMVGEIRDLETAEIAIKAAQTGHLVLSTLHTNDAPQAILRLINMGIPAYHISSSIQLIIAQRLLRLLCQYCKKPVEYAKETLDSIGFTAYHNTKPTFYEAVGCSECHLGYKGRTGIYQILPFSDKLNQIILRHANQQDIEKLCMENNIQSLRQSALNKMALGLTSLTEINRITLE